MTADPKYWAVVPAAGAGRRMGMEVPKQYLKLGKQTVLEHSIDALLESQRFSAIVVVISADDEYWATLETRYSGRRVVTVHGGDERSHSVLAGLEFLSKTGSSDDWVLVHDAARPCVRPGDINKLIDELNGDPDGGLLGVPVTDTMKRSDKSGRIESTVPRDDLWRALTPQMFRLGQLRAALRQAVEKNVLVTDEAAAMELAGHRPRMVEGHSDNIKITIPTDLTLAGFYLQSRRT